jgi:hypothetical protein
LRPIKPGPRALITEPAGAMLTIASQSLITKTPPLGYGEGEEVALAVALAAALCPGEGLLAGCALFCGGGSSGAEGRSVLSVALWGPLLRSGGEEVGSSDGL